MPLPPPAHTLTLPSLHDDTALACDIRHPSPSTSFRGGVVLAHPYAPLGGSSSDPVIGLIAATCLRSGYVVATFDFRGAGTSAGRTSWTSKPEREDYITVAAFVVEYVSELARWQGRRRDGEVEIEVVLGGYSYGSMVARQVPPVDELTKRFENSKMGGREAAVTGKAVTLAREYMETASSSFGCTPTFPTITTSYLLISPLLWPVSSALSLQMPLLSSSPDNTDINLTTHKTLAVFGGNDVFSPSKRLRAWASRLSNQPSSCFSPKHIPAAGHFWHEPDVGRQLQEAVAAWLDRIDTQSKAP